MMPDIILEYHTDEELKKLEDKIQTVLKRRRSAELEKAQEALRAFLEDYAQKGIRFYEPDGYGGEHTFSTTDVFAEERW